MSGISLTFFKVCTKCGCTKPATTVFFSPQRRGKYGYTSQCRACRYWHKRHYRRENLAAIRDAEQRYRNANRETIQENHRRWRESTAARETERRYIERNRPRLLEYKRQWYERNREEQREKGAAYYQENKERHRVWNRRYLNRKRGQSGEPYTFDDLYQMYEDQEGLCAYCETPLFATYHVDHMIPLSRGGQDCLWNLALACPACNLRKSAQTAEEFMR